MSVLHLGCGVHPLPEWVPDRDETRLDLDPATSPDIVASITDVGDIGPFNIVFSSHVLEHVYPHETQQALRESCRVLVDGGYAVHVVPDLENVKATDEVLYESPAGPVTGLDMIYGMRSMVEQRPHMAHKNGFTRATLEKALVDAGFSRVAITRTHLFNLVGVGVK